MAMRHTTVITKLISNDQCGFIRGRNIPTILRTTDDIINYLNNENLSGILVSIDFAKAFDTISKTLIRDSLKIYEFVQEFQRWINTLLANTESAINHYWWISQSFQVERGIRQGCPLSPSPFRARGRSPGHQNQSKPYQRNTDQEQSYTRRSPVNSD